MAGRPDFSQSGTEGGGQTVATQSRPEIVTQDVTQTGSVAAGNTETVEIYAPTGATYTIVDMLIRVDLDTDWTSGDHFFRMMNPGGWATIIAESTYTSKLLYLYHYWSNADSRLEPPTTEEMVDALNNLRATDSSPIQLKYTNNCDVAQENQRQYKFVFEQVSF